MAKSLKIDHSHTLTTSNNSCIMSINADKPVEGINMLQEVIMDGKRVLGPYHQDTLASILEYRCN